VHEGAQVGRIARLEPGTFENGSVYQHAVAFYILALLRAGRAEQAAESFQRLLPTNPDNFDCRRTAEPYCTGNFYCGPGHPRAGQNFFTWFTGNAAWLLRLGFEEMLGVKAGFDGLIINPQAPAAWSKWQVQRHYRGCHYNLHFIRDRNAEAMMISVNGQPLTGNTIPPLSTTQAVIQVALPALP
jgi:cellobionic acid phosphorylase